MKNTKTFFQVGGIVSAILMSTLLILLCATTIPHGMFSGAILVFLTIIAVALSVALPLALGYLLFVCVKRILGDDKTKSPKITTETAPSPDTANGDKDTPDNKSIDNNELTDKKQLPHTQGQSLNTGIKSDVGGSLLSDPDIGKPVPATGLSAPLIPPA